MHEHGPGPSGQGAVVTRLSSAPGGIYAIEDATRTANQCGVHVALLDDMRSIAEAVEAFQVIWGFAPSETPVTGELLRAMLYAGGYVAGARRDGALVGASAGFLGTHGRELHLHSHISGVLPAAQGTQVGLALKQHQRAWALDRGITVVEWTFDPLIRRNAYFNLVKLGAVIVAYEPEFYGTMRDAINANDETDRAVVRWSLASERAVRAARGERGVDAPAGSAVLRAGDDGEPQLDAAVLHDRPAAMRAYIPDDIVAVRRRDAGRALHWRRAVRDTVGVAIRSGYVATSMSRDGWYTLVREDR